MSLSQTMTLVEGSVEGRETFVFLASNDIVESPTRTIRDFCNIGKVFGTFKEGLDHARNFAKDNGLDFDLNVRHVGAAAA